MTSATSDAYDRLPDGVAEIFGADATAERAYDLLTVDVPAAAWLTALETARDELGCTYFDWLSAVDEPGTGFRVGAHVASVEPRSVRRLLIRTTVPHEAAVLPTALGVYAGAGWHERETYEMFGISFTDHPNLVHLLLPETFEGHPLRKDFVLAARVAKAWPGAKEPGESAPGHTGPKRRQMLPPGVPDPNEWGPLKGQLPPAPARPARTPRAASNRPPRRTRSVTEGSATQQPPPAKTTAAPWHAPTPAFEEPPRSPPPPDAPPADGAERAPKSPPARGDEPTAAPDATAKPAPAPDARPERAPAGKSEPAPYAGAEPGSAPAPEDAATPGPDSGAPAAPGTGSRPGPEPTASPDARPGRTPENESAAAPDAAPEAGPDPERTPAPEPDGEPAPDDGPAGDPDDRRGHDRPGGDA
ncbi:NADH-quinone oxidoreductase chain 5 [Streptomyces sp. S4.7]|uniref:NADH-quinone oxidoreductase subunit C n=1 Tax=Streptomyces sp. S4.7 TaxID=2705439 RepID=UPI001397AAF9|nr:NADH-quinone oxidoreductase subunit C [Streptomyces sp. S4.7]QHY97505.1 NADH-quinone oxidoreductase chain 5 [Streptomyces sp. S4.7]